MDLHLLFLSLGGILLVGLMTDELGRRTRLPRVTLLILFGVIIGPSGLDLLPDQFAEWYEFLAATALTMVAFLLGGHLSLAGLRKRGKTILIVSAVVVVLTALAICGGLMALGASFLLALLLAGIGTATDPAASQDVIKQTGAKGPFTRILLGIVAIDDAWGLIIFSLLLVIAKAVTGGGFDDILWNAGRELGGAVGIGLLIGLPGSYLSGRIRPGEPMQLEALGLVFLCAGLAIWLDVSFLLSGMIAGFIIVNFAKHHNRAFHEIEHIEWPFMVFFFVLAGASLQIAGIVNIGMVGLGYIILRIVGRLVGGWLGCQWAGTAPRHKLWLGLALMPQAGVALGMALVASDHFPEIGDQLLAITIGTTVIFEIVGPILTLVALKKVGETR
ncbi:cation:proton antiporter [uncultured Cohaesibacter sp.]|uniref:cation:proton antiporter n=1 Tax=uncultured Cohaesibacter sp. TaxID=1002546 RepID=UPI002AAB5754|nr:cation:proton antiporter [uncultured Cohaesibacter sp.]